MSDLRVYPTTARERFNAIRRPRISIRMEMRHILQTAWHIGSTESYCSPPG
jgi:hypothetical protein